MDVVANGDGVGAGRVGWKRRRVCCGGGGPDTVLIELQAGGYGGAWDVLDGEDAVVGCGEVIVTVLPLAGVPPKKRAVESVVVKVMVPT